MTEKQSTDCLLLKGIFIHLPGLVAYRVEFLFEYNVPAFTSTMRTATTVQFNRGFWLEPAREEGCRITNCRCMLHPASQKKTTSRGRSFFSRFRRMQQRLDRYSIAFPPFAGKRSDQSNISCGRNRLICGM
ncbi:MAG: hypothetical protein A3I66_10875 [Burkholderiales bacterium RIFCSPLOWO2_02_FULL_57_36]|nr:MAG: hypothetical protein A3I66_10875 [Burkholderiales bacterium RIFCSPLOWO2_02_FULL_57_36]